MSSSSTSGGWLAFFSCSLRPPSSFAISISLAMLGFFRHLLRSLSLSTDSAGQRVRPSCSGVSLSVTTKDHSILEVVLTP